ncbi:MAG: hypothetical protein JWM76_2704 [Pseudonocardiales bacterium]|nr:hypothetical protein [Pseudonocardiales bacterium]
MTESDTVSSAVQPRAVHPPYDPQLAPVIAAMDAQGPQSLTADIIPSVRASSARYAPSDDQLRRGGTVSVEERLVPGPAGAPDVSLLICRPTGVDGPIPTIYNIHGGGMVMGTNRTGLDRALDLVVELQIMTVSVEYRLAPEYPHPAPVEDCYAGLVWTIEHAGEIGVDPSRVIVLGGSAGGGLAAGVTLLARDRGGPAVLGAVLMAPMLDDRCETHSIGELDGEGIWDRTSNLTGWGALLGDARGGPDVSPYAAPARAEDLSGLPPLYIEVGSADTLRDEDVAFATRIWQAGGTAELHVWSGGFHGSDQFAPTADLTLAARERRLSWLRRLLAN